ncbi:YIP1 family protein [Pleionea sp. CnH1-48]|uniref:YIP1 family protein n=1 Tax=Pleionea sp. CnH1-48 TaxID=2954494 RepID=UPI002097875D|nr:YIP1 family protein [Pleionea sp. CnH1-48]MCO7225430.1 YIP1 family protein [Pleionea sp. CnH1-48]
MSVMSSLVDIFASPSKAFTERKENGKVFLPLMLILGLSVFQLWLYFDKVDYDYYIDYSVSQSAEDMTPAQIEQTRDALSSIPKTGLMSAAMGSAAVMTLILFLLLAVYLIVVSNVRNDELTFGQCFSLIVWSHFVMIVSILIGIVGILLADSNQIPLEIARGLSLQNLLSLAEPADNTFKIWSNLDLSSAVWANILLAIGYKQFTNSSMTASLIIGFIPTTIIMTLVVMWAL